MTVQKLKTINTVLTDVELDLYTKKLLYKEQEAKLLLETDFEEALGKKRPTVDEKKAFVFLKLKDFKQEVDEAQAQVDELKRDYEIEKLNVRFTGNFLNTIAKGAQLNDDD